jgi:signal transduction histidine kinase
VYAEEEERRRIAREMHDQCGQDLTALRLQAERLRAQVRPALRDSAEALEAIAARLDHDIDFLVWELRPTVLDGVRLCAALAKYAESWSAHFGVPVDVQVTGGFDRVTPKIESALYRITQETLTNVARHARARSVGIMLKGDDDQVSLVIEDDGVGFDSTCTGVAGRGLGLLGMHERVALVAGTVEVESAPGRGTTVIVRIPTPAAGSARD